MLSPEQLSSKTGPLAHVLLAANQERKLSKSQVLQSDIQKSIGAIVGQGAVPAALRLSSQLLLGVAHIYGKKARFLRDDCHEALLKIHTAFRAGARADKPADAPNVGHARSLDFLTMEDLFPPMNFAHPQIPQPAGQAHTEVSNVDWTLSLEPSRASQSKSNPDDPILVIDEDLGLDFGDGDEFDRDDIAISSTPRRTTPAMGAFVETVVYEEEDRDRLGLTLGSDDDSFEGAAVGGQLDLQYLGGNHDGSLFDEYARQMPPAAGSMGLDCEIRVSEVGSENMHDLDQAFSRSEDEVSEVAIQRPQQSKKMKSIVPDADTVFSKRQLKEFSEDRSNILTKPMPLPHNRAILKLMDMEKNGDFVTHAMNDGVSANWASELQGLLSFETVHQCSQKRKRDSESSIISDEEYFRQPLQHLEYDVNGTPDIIDGREQSVRDIATDDGIRSDAPALGDWGCEQNDEEVSGGVDEYDDHMVSPVDTADGGALSSGTQGAMHLLGDNLGPQSFDSISSLRMDESVLLHELVPVEKTSREEATKLFFDILVLATKDVIQVDQGQGEFGLPVRIRGKQGHQGSWAETSL